MTLILCVLLVPLLLPAVFGLILGAAMIHSAHGRGRSGGWWR